MAKTLTVEFSTSTGCNYRCSYCYSNHKPQTMNIDVADKFFDVVGDLMKIYDCDSYHISYFGGEPLMNFDIIKYTLPKFKADERCRSTVVITNGALMTEEIRDFLRANDCSISWSFDGINQSQNRPTASGIDSFSELMSKKDLLLSLTNSCKVMLDAKSFKNMTENLDFFVNFGINCPDYSLVRDNIYKEEDIKTYEIEIERLANKVIAYNHGFSSYEKFLNQEEQDIQPQYVNVGLFRLYILDTLINRRYGKRSHGCFVGFSGGVYTTEGDIYPCERFRSTKKLQIYDGKTKTFNKENIEFLKRPDIVDPRQYEDCKTCEIYEFCNAGCTWSQLINGRFKTAKPVGSVCDLLRLSYKQALRVFHLCPQSFRDRMLNELNNIG